MLKDWQPSVLPDGKSRLIPRCVELSLCLVRTNFTMRPHVGDHMLQNQENQPGLKKELSERCLLAPTSGCCDVVSGD